MQPARNPNLNAIKNVLSLIRNNSEQLFIMLLLEISFFAALFLLSPLRQRISESIQDLGIAIPTAINTAVQTRTSPSVISLLFENPIVRPIITDILVGILLVILITFTAYIFIHGTIWWIASNSPQKWSYFINLFAKVSGWLLILFFAYIAFDFGASIPALQTSFSLSLFNIKLINIQAIISWIILALLLYFGTLSYALISKIHLNEKNEDEKISGRRIITSAVRNGIHSFPALLMLWIIFIAVFFLLELILNQTLFQFGQSSFPFLIMGIVLVPLYLVLAKVYLANAVELS